MQERMQKEMKATQRKFAWLLETFYGHHLNKYKRNGG